MTARMTQFERDRRVTRRRQLSGPRGTIRRKSPPLVRQAGVTAQPQPPAGHGRRRMHKTGGGKASRKSGYGACADRCGGDAALARMLH